MAFNGYRFIGTDLLGEDDLTVNPPWVMSNITVTAAGGDAYTISASTDGNSRNLNGNNRTVANEQHYGFVWARAGTVSSFEAGLLVGSFGVTAATIMVGPGSAAVASSRCVVTGLATDTWSLVRYTTAAAGASSLADFLIYPNQVNPQIAGDSIILAQPRLAAVAEDARWVAEGTTLGQGRLGIIGKPLRGRL